MTRRHRSTVPTGRLVLLADDDPDYLEATRLLLESEGHEVMTAENGPATLDLARRHSADLLLLDYFMPGMTGEAVVNELRQFDPHVQVVLQTGFSDDQPPREMLRRLDIQGYYDKSEGPEKLLLWTDAGLKASSTLYRLARTARGVRQLLDLTPELYVTSPPARLFESIVHGAAELVATLITPERESTGPQKRSSPADGLLALADVEGALCIEAATGALATGTRQTSALPKPLEELVTRAAKLGEPAADGSSSVVPLRLGPAPIGALVVQHPLEPSDLDVLRLYADQAALVIENAHHYAASSRDPVTGVHSAAYFEQCLRREVRAALRTRRPVSLVALAVEPPPSSGDRLLARAASAARRQGRPDDILGLRGTEELWLLLPHTATRGAQRVIQRLVGPEGHRSATFTSAGVATLEAHRGTPGPSARPTAALVSMVGALLSDRAARARHETDPVGGVPIRVSPPTTWAEIVTLPRGDA